MPPRRRHPTPRQGRPGGRGDWLAELAAIGSDPARWDALESDELLLIAFQQCLYFAHTQDPGANEALAGLYVRLRERAGEDARLGLLEQVAESVERGGTSVVALLPFLQHERSPRLVALAAQSFATLMPAAAGDELTGPRTLVRMAEHAEDDLTRVGLAAGLLGLGDPRVRPLAGELWRAMGAAARSRLAAEPPVAPLVFSATVEFWLDCLEDADESTSDAVAGALERLLAEAAPPRVLEVSRRFPAPGGAADELTVTGDWTLAEYGRRIAARLGDLARRGNDPHRLARVAALLGAPGAA